MFNVFHDKRHGGIKPEGMYLIIIKAACHKPTLNIILNSEKLKTIPLK